MLNPKTIFIRMLFCAMIILLYVPYVQAQAFDKNSALFNYNQKSIKWFEGFDTSVNCNDFNYHSLRDDLRESFIVRCKEGLTKAEWLTQTIPADYAGPTLNFGWIAALNLVNKPNLKLDVYVNDIKRFEIPFKKNSTWQIENPEGGLLSFDVCEFDRYNDAHGYMSLQMPTNWGAKGKSVKISITATSANENTWIIIYKAKDALSSLRNGLKFNLEMSLAIDKGKKEISIQAPLAYKNKELSYSLNRKQGKVLLKEAGSFSEGILKLSDTLISGTEFILSDTLTELIKTDDIAKISNYDKIVGKSVIRIESGIKGNSIFYGIKRLFAPKVTEAIIRLEAAKTGNKTIYLMNSSHQDIAWMDTPEKCVIERDTMLITPLLEKAFANSNYRFDIEDALMLKEYIARHPNKKTGIAKLLNNGQLSCGSTFIQPYEEMYSGESLIRQFYLGTRWLKKEFGYDANTYWNVDVPGRTLQMAQIAKKAGSKYMVISRHQEGIYNWFSPDGSFVSAYSPGHYGDAMIYLTKDFLAAAPPIADNCLKWNKYFDGKKESVIPLLSDSDMSPAKNYGNIISRWGSIKEMENEKGETFKITLPEIKLSTTPEFFDRFTSNAANIPSIKGERPAVWLYIQHPTHKDALDASRRGDLLLTAAEKFSTINSMLDNDFNKYPAEELSKAWEAKIYPDHGWGGKGGDITDALFKEKFVFAKSEGERLLNKSLTSISSMINTGDIKGIPLVVFNSLSWKRTSPVIVKVNFNDKGAKSVKLFNISGLEIPVQLNNVEYYTDGYIKSALLVFTAKDVPSIGYKTYYLKEVNTEPIKSKLINSPVIENKFYRIELNEKGIKSIYDKELNKELVDVSKFYAGEVFSMKSVGEDAGEFADIQMPTMEGFDKTSDYKIKWKMTADGPVFTSVKFRQKIKDAIVEEEIVVYKQIKKIDFNISLLDWEGVMFREFRLAFPLNMNDGQVSYEVPFGVVNVGKDELEGAAGERYTTPCKDVHPRGIENWIGASNNKFGVTISSSVGVVDYIDPTTNPVKQQIIQPILLASRRSCHEEGPEYPQKGDHFFHFSLTSHKPGWENGYKLGKAANEELQIVFNPKKSPNANLPEEQSFFSLDAGNVIISTIKKGEDNDGIIVRMYETEGKESKIQLKTFKPINEIFKTNIIEYHPEKINISGKVPTIEIGKNSIETFLIK